MATVTSGIKQLRTRITWRGVRRVGAGLIAAWAVIMIVLFAAIFIYGSIDFAQESDVIVVLGAGLQPNNRPGPALIRRTDQAAKLWEQGIADRIICSGGFGLNRERSEADGCAELLRGHGIPAEAILLEEQSRSTEENAIYTGEVMTENGWQTAVLVSDGYHLLRATWIFSRQGISHSTSPAEAPPFFNLLASTLREIIAFHWLVFKWLFNIPVTYVPVL
jgi:uncharacterized SAM-binding protein YcdF (DUF218 family)